MIIAQDEAPRIAGCLASVGSFSDEVLVLDGGSTDATIRIAEQAGCRVIKSPWPGYARQRNRGAREAAHDWIFFLDADERVDGELAAELERWKRRGEDATRAFAVRRVGDLLGVWLTYRSEHLVRLYDRRRCELDDVEVHEQVVFRDGSGQVGRLGGTLWHHGFRSIHDHVARFNRYTSLETVQARAAGTQFSLGRLLWRPPARFAQRFVLQGGMRFGLAGLVDAVLWTYYEVMRELKLIEPGQAPSPGPAGSEDLRTGSSRPRTPVP